MLLSVFPTGLGIESQSLGTDVTLIEAFFICGSISVGYVTGSSFTTIQTMIMIILNYKSHAVNL